MLRPPWADPLTLADLLRVANSPGFDRWQEQVRRTGGCADPIHLPADRHPRPGTGQRPVLLRTEDEPGGRLRVACGNRRASRCPSCAWTYAGDTYHLIRAGLTGDARASPRRCATTPGSSPPSPPPRSARSTTGPAPAAAAAALKHPDG